MAFEFGFPALPRVRGNADQTRYPFVRQPSQFGQHRHQRSRRYRTNAFDLFRYFGFAVKMCVGVVGFSNPTFWALLQWIEMTGTLKILSDTSIRPTLAERQRSRLRPGRGTGRLRFRRRAFLRQPPHLRHLQRQGTGTLRLRRLRRFDRRLRTRRQKTARFRLPQPHHGRTQPARRTGVPLRIRPLRHRRQSAQKQQQPRRRMDVRLPQRPYRRYRRIGADGGVGFRRKLGT